VPNRVCCALSFAGFSFRFLVVLQLFHCCANISLADQVVSLEDTASSPTANRHDDALGNAGTAQIASRCSAEVMEEQSRLAGRLAGFRPRKRTCDRCDPSRRQGDPDTEDNRGVKAWSRGGTLIDVAAEISHPLGIRQGVSRPALRSLHSINQVVCKED